MSGIYDGIVGECEEFCFNGVDEVVEAGAWEVCSSDGGFEECVTGEEDVLFGAVEGNSSGCVAWCVYDVQLDAGDV